MWVTNAHGDLMLTIILYSKILNQWTVLSTLCLCSTNKHRKPGCPCTVYTLIAEYLRSRIEVSCSEKKNCFKILTSHWQWGLDHSRFLLRCIWITISALPITFIQKPINQWVMLSYNFFSLKKNVFHMGPVSIDNDSSGESKKRKEKIFWKEFTGLDLWCIKGRQEKSILAVGPNKMMPNIIDAKL